MTLPLQRKMIVTFCLFILGCGLVTAQSGRVRPTGQEQSEDKIQLSVEEVLIPINVKSTSSHLPPEVTAADFLVTEGGKQQKVTAVMRTPANILLLIDASGTVTQRKNLQINRDVAGQIVKSIHADDQASIDSFVPKWNEDAVVALQRSRASVYIVSPNAAIMGELRDKVYYTGDWYDRIDPKVRNSTNALRDYYHRLEGAAATLKDLAKELDGAMWNPETWKEIEGITGTIESEFETEYMLAYRAERRPDNQEFLPIQVVPTRQDIKIRVQSGVYVSHKN